jgi:hypothetical protein
VTTVRSAVVSGLLVFALVGGVVAGSVGPVTAQQSTQNVQIDATVVGGSEPIAGETTVVEVTVSNLASSTASVDVDSIRVRDAGTLDILSRVDDVSSVDPGGSLTVEVPTTFEEPGDQLLSVVAYVESGDGRGVARYERPVYVDVDAPTVRAQLDATVPANQYGVTDVAVQNVGNTNWTDVTLTASANGTVVDRVLLDDLARATNRSVALDTRAVAGTPVTVTLTYTANDATHTVTDVIDLGEREAVLGTVRLTSVERSSTTTGVRIEGDAANVGGTDVSSVLVRIPNTSTVTPTPPAADYFVGSIEASEFATFELTAATVGNVSQVPVEITYIAENERRTHTQQVSLGASTTRAAGVSGAQATDGAAATTDDSGGGVPTVIIGVVIAVLVAALGVVRWRRG